MRKSLFFLSYLIGLLSFIGCSKDDSTIDNGNTSKSTKIRWYGLKTSNEPATRGVTDKSKLWNKEAGIAIKFINNPADAKMIEKIKSIASEWETYAGIKFNYVESDKNASVRIAFDWQGNDWLTWSYTGTDAKYVRNQAEPTAVFGGLQYQDDEQFKGDVLRVFGQILGLEYEQRHQDWTFWRDETKLQSYWTDMFDGMNMDWDEIRDYVFTPLSGNNAISLTQTPEIDELSVMAWPYYARTQTTKILANYELSDGDKAFIATLYPKNQNTLPTIQEAWVDAGYFTWTDNTKTALRITELGAEQEYLPDVSDGEQLTSATSMFSGANKLKKAPFFNTSNILTFRRMFNGCSSLTNTPIFDTKNATDFGFMFYSCSSLIEIPLINTTKGSNFNGMLANCTSLKSVPLLNTSKGIIFNGMLSGCRTLKEIPLLDTSNGTDFNGMFTNCTSLEIIPLLNTSKGTNFGIMFANCQLLKEIPLLNTSKSTTFYLMFDQCKSLTSIPQLNTSKGTSFEGMFSSCESLKEIPLLDTSNGKNFNNMFSGCKSLNKVPLLNISHGTDFSFMFGWCSSLSQIPLLNTSNGINFDGMFTYCSTLQQIPAFDTSNGTNFRQMFGNCSSLIGISSLKTSKGTDFSFMFYNCYSLIEKPRLDLSNASEIKFMYKGTPFENDLI